MSFGDYALGVAGVAVIAVSLGIGARRARAAIVPTWQGAPARLAEVVVGASALFVLAELLGIAGVMTGLALAIGSVAIGVLAMVLIPSSSASDADQRPAAEAAASPAMTAIALAIGLIVIAHWAIAAQVSLDYGIYNADDLQSHLPTAARFAQDGSIAHLVFATPSFLVWLYPANSELFQAIGMTLFDGDFTAPLLNLLWVALTLLAAWCFGRRFGAAPQAMTAAALLLDTPLMIATQAGTSKNDTLILAFFASALALLVTGAAEAKAGNGALRLPDRPIEPGALALAGLATGFAAGTKFSVVVTAGALAAGIVWIAPAGTRVRTAALFVLPALATCGFWYLRNLIDSGNPLPWVDEVGPITLPGLHQSLNQAPHLFSVGGRLTDTDAWSDAFAPGFSDEIGPLWPVVLALAGLGLVWGLLTRAWAVRVIAAAGVVALLVYLALPLGSVDESGDLVGFAYALRHLTPVLLFGLLLAASLATRLGGRAAWLTLGLFAVLVLFFTRRGLDFWEGTGHLAGAILIATALVAVPVSVAVLSRGPGRLAALALAAGAVAAIVVTGWPQARDYADARYRTELPESVYERFQLDRNITPLLPLYRWAQGVHDARIGTSAVLQYGLYDDELTNHVQYVGVRGPNAGFDIARSCEEWRQAVNSGGYDYVVAAPRYGGTRVPQRDWTAEPGVTEVVLQTGPVTVFKLNGELDPARCH
jgi:hypothetical protein